MEIRKYNLVFKSATIKYGNTVLNRFLVGVFDLIIVFEYRQGKKKPQYIYYTVKRKTVKKFK